MNVNTLYIAGTTDKGRGVFAAVEFNRGDIIELCHIIEIGVDDRAAVHDTGLHDYYFVWGDKEERAAFALGYGSLYNHSDTPNAQFVNDLENDLIIIECLSNIVPGTEICINYIDHRSNEKLWFKTNKV